MNFGFQFFFNSILLGVGLAMDAFSVSLANGLNEPKMTKGKMAKVAGIFAGFQFLMPMIGWFCVTTLLELFSAFEPLIPWIALGLLGYIGGKMLLENLRFHKEEEKNDPEFSKALASLAEIYVNDAFGSAHRAHSSTTGVADYLPAVGGFLIRKELEYIGGALESPKRPLVAILGGAKVSDKIGVITNLMEKVDTLIVGGGMAYTFFAAKGYSVGTSICEEDKIEMAKEMMAAAEAKGVKFLIPVDNRLGKEYKEDTDVMVVDSDSIPDDWMGLDIGPKTEELFADAIKGAGTVIWNGPMGVSEWDQFASGTISVAKAVAAATDAGAVSIIGGGDSAAAVKKLGFNDKMTHVSTGGGASLEFLEGKDLPGIACIATK